MDVIRKGIEIFPDVKVVGCKLKDIGEKHNYFGISDKLKEKYNTIKGTIYDKYRYIFYSFDQSYLDSNLNIDVLNPNTPSKMCKTNPNLFIHLTCEEGLILTSYANTINNIIKSSKQINIDDLIQFRDKVKLILNQTEEKMPQFTFLQTIINYEISKIKDSKSFFRIFFNSVNNLIILSLIITTFINIPGSMQKVFKLSIFEFVMQIVLHGSELYLKAYNAYEENGFSLFKKRMEKTNYEGKLNQNSLYNMMVILNFNIESIIEKIQKFTTNKIISVDNICLNNLELCYSDECINKSISKKILEKLYKIQIRWKILNLYWVNIYYHFKFL